MKKIISTITIVAICILIFTGCSKSSTKDIPFDEPITFELNTVNDYYIAFETTFFYDADAKQIFKLIANENQKTESGYRTLKRYLNTHEFNYEPIGQVWKLGNRCYFVIDKYRHLYLSKSNKNLNECYHILNNVDSYNVKDELYILNSPAVEFPKTCIIGDMTFVNGQFWYLGEILFDTIKLGGIVELSNYQISPDGTKYIVATSGERTILITEKNHTFNSKQIEFN